MPAGPIEQAPLNFWPMCAAVHRRSSVGGRPFRRRAGDRPGRQVAKDAADGAALNLVNAPAPQAAETILGDILSVRYTVDPGTEGNVPIQTPNPRSSICFRRHCDPTARRLLNNNGTCRILVADQTIVGINIRTNDGPDADQIGSGFADRATQIRMRNLKTVEIQESVARCPYQETMKII